jgi:hypothetical protein
MPARRSQKRRRADMSVSASKRTGRDEGTPEGLMTPEQVMAYLRCGRSHVFALLRSGAIRSLKVGRFTVFAGLGGTEENDVGPVAARMRVLRPVAQQNDLGVVLIRHAGKDGTPRGSSAFEAEADICITLGMPEGRHAITVRRLRGKGRYGLWERNVELKGGRYISLGSDNRIEFSRAVALIKAVLPESPEVGIRKRELLDRGAEENISATTITRALDWLVEQGEVGEKQLIHERGQPKVYWLAFKP